MKITKAGKEHWDYIVSRMFDVLSGETFVTTFWCKEDIQSISESKLTNKELENIKNDLINEFDAEIGTNWDVIYTFINEREGL